MPFCTQCGNQVSPADAFCGACGFRQQGATPASSDFLGGISPRTASILCYVPVLGWIPAVVVLAAQRFRNERQARFHAFQGLYLFVAWLILDWGIGPFLFFDRLSVLHIGIEKILKAILMVAWIFMIIKTSQNEDYRLPVFGELAERSVAEQR